MKAQTVSVRTAGTDALVQTSVQTFSVTNASTKNRKNSSPVELLLSSLGS